MHIRLNRRAKPVSGSSKASRSSLFPYACDNISADVVNNEEEEEEDIVVVQAKAALEGSLNARQ